nr:unnamed protein product [Digitaria exilis]
MLFDEDLYADVPRLFGDIDRSPSGKRATTEAIEGLVQVAAWPVARIAPVSACTTSAPARRCPAAMPSTVPLRLHLDP